VLSVAFSLDGRLLAAGDEKKVTIWDLDEAKRKYTFGPYNERTKHVSFSPDGKSIIVGNQLATSILAPSNERCQVAIYDALTGELCTTVGSGYTYAVNCSLSPDGRRMLSCCADGIIKLWRTDNWKETATVDGSGTAIRMAVSPLWKTMATAGWNGDLVFWDLETLKRYQRIAGAHSTVIPAIAFSNDGSFVATGSYDETVKVWDVTQGTCLNTFKCSGEVQDVAISSDDRLIAAAEHPGGMLHLPVLDKGRARVWDLAKNREIAVFTGHQRGIWAVAFSPNGEFLATGDFGGRICLWRLPGR
jgi:WD40 repeat protein